MKQSRLKKAYFGTVLFTIMLSLITLGITWYNERGYRSSKNTLSRMNLVGKFYLNDSMEEHELTENVEFELKGINTMTVKGHFTNDVKENMKVMLRIDNLRVHIEINGETIYSFDEDKKYVKYAKSGGNLWESFISNGITTSDEVTVTLTNVYTNHVESTFKRFFNNIYYGNDTEYARVVLRGRLLNCFVGMLILIMGIFAMVFTYVTYRLKQPVGIMGCFSGLSISAGIWFFIDFEIQNILFPSPVFNNSLDMITMMLTSYFVLCFIAQHLNTKWRHVLRINGFCFILAILVGTILQFAGILDYYETYPVMYVFGGSGVVFAVVAVLYERYKGTGKKTLQLAITTILMAAGGLGDLVGIYTEVLSNTKCFRAGILIFLLVEFIEIVHTFRCYILEAMRVTLLEEMAYKDALTGVKNRAAYLEKVQEINEKSKTEELEFAVLVFDINNLKKVNDTMGHDHGDRLIRKVAAQISESFGIQGLYRIGGDEFVIIVEGKDARDRFQQLQEFETCCEKEEMQIACGTSGYNANTDQTFKEVFSRADQAMYEVKKRMKQLDKAN